MARHDLGRSGQLHGSGLRRGLDDEIDELRGMSSEVAEKCCIASELSILIYDSFNKTQVALKSADQLSEQSQV